MVNKILSVDELREMSLNQVKQEYVKLTKLYSRRMYEREKEDKELFEVIYGKRLTQGQMYKEFLKDVDADLAEKNQFIKAYQNLAQKMGGATGISKKAVGQLVDVANVHLTREQKKFLFSKAKRVKAFQDQVEMLDLNDFPDWYSWYGALVAKYGNVLDKAEAGRKTKLEGDSVVNEIFKSGSKSISGPEEDDSVPADLLGKIG